MPTLKVLAILSAMLIGILPSCGANAQTDMQQAQTIGAGKGQEIFNNVTSKTPTAATVPGYSGATPQQSQLFQGGKGDIVGPGQNRATSCINQGDTECTAVNLIQWGPNNRPKPTFSPSDSLLSNARSRMLNAPSTLGAFATASGSTAGGLNNVTTQCIPTTVTTAANYQNYICDETVLRENKICPLDQTVIVNGVYDYECEKSVQSKTTQTCNKTLSVTCTSAAQQLNCPTGTTLFNGRCQSTSSANESAIIGSYTCPDGTATANANDCKTTVNTTATTTYTCADGMTLTGSGSSSTCTTTTATPATPITTYSCPNGSDFRDGNCILTTSQIPGAVVFPDNWASYSSTQKINWYNANNVTPVMMLAAGVPQSEIDWMSANGYLNGWSCPHGGSLSGTTCIISTTTPAIPITRYTCADGMAPTGSGSSSSCTTTTTVTATPNINYSCESGMTLTGSGGSYICTTEQIPGAVVFPDNWASYSSTQKINWYNANNVTPVMLLAAGVPQSEIDWMSANGYLNGWSCPNGASLSGTTCIITTTTPAVQNTTYTCAGGVAPTGSGINSICTTTTTTPATPITTYSCANGSDLKDGNCIQTSIQTPGAVVLPSNWASFSTTQKIDWFNANNVTPMMLLAAGVPRSDIDWMSENGYRIGWICPNGASLSGTTCIITTTTPATPNTTYTCAGGVAPTGSGINSICTTTTTTPATPITTYSCANGSDLKDGNCIQTSTQPATKNDQLRCLSGYILTGNKCTTPANSNTTYTCPNGVIPINNICTISTSVQAIASTTDTCADSSTPINGICTKNISSYAATQNNQYRCLTGYILTGNNCVSTVPATANTVFTCTAGQTLTDSKTCNLVMTKPATPVYTCQGDASQELRSASTENLICPPDYQRNGSKCTYFSYDRFACQKIDLSGWSQISSTLHEDMENFYLSSCTVLAKQANDTCPVGTILVGAVCASTVTISATIIDYTKAGGATCSVQTRAAGTPIYGCKPGGIYNSSDNTCTYILTTDTDPSVSYSCPANVALTATSVLNGVPTYSCCTDTIQNGCSPLEAREVK